MVWCLGISDDYMIGDNKKDMMIFVFKDNDFHPWSQEAYRKAVQESRGALEEDEEDASKADKDKEQVIKMIFLVIMMRILSPFYLTPHPRFQNRGSLKLRQDIAMSPEQNLVILIITKKNYHNNDNHNDYNDVHNDNQWWCQL